MKATEQFKKEVNEAWGTSRAVAEAGLNECFRHGDKIGLDYDDQIDLAVRIGILAGETKNKVASVFIEQFERDILRHEEGEEEDDDDEDD